MNAQEFAEGIDIESGRSSFINDILGNRRTSGGNNSRRQSKSSVFGRQSFGRYGKLRPTEEDMANERIARAFARLEKACVTEEARGSLKVRSRSVQSAVPATPSSRILF